MRPMETVQDLIEEAKVRAVWWGLIIFCVAYFLSNTSKSMYMNVPLAMLVALALRILTKEVEFRWKPRSETGSMTYLSYLSRKQLSLNDPRLSNALPPVKWKRKIDSLVVEAAADDFVGKLLRDFVVDLWYSDITPDKEFPELVRRLIMEAIGEISGRVKQLNLVDLLTRDIVDLVGDHIDLFRRNQAAIGVDVMGILSSEERDDRLKHHLMASKELHPALISPECEYKVLQRLVEGILTVVLGPREVQCPLVRCIARELVTCLVLRPVMDFASPVFVNKVIELVVLSMNDDQTKDTDDVPKSRRENDGHLDYSRATRATQDVHPVSRNILTSDSGDNVRFVKESYQEQNALESVQTSSANWARVMEAATQRRTEVLAPENLENMWAKGRHYNTKVPKSSKAAVKRSIENVSDANIFTSTMDSGKESVDHRLDTSKHDVNQTTAKLPPQGTHKRSNSDCDASREPDIPVGNKSNEFLHHQDELSEQNYSASSEDSGRRKRSFSATRLQVESEQASRAIQGLVISEDFYSSSLVKSGGACSTSSKSDVVPQIQGKPNPRLRCQVVGASFEKIGSNSITVYSISVKDEENMTWHVKRRYSNFERLHRQLKVFPNYTLLLPPKRIFSSSTEDRFVHQRCIQLNSYLQDLLSIGNVVEHHEVWDFLSASSKNYSFGKSSSVMKTLAVNVDDAVDDIVRQFKGVADGLTRKVVGSSPSPNKAHPSLSAKNMYFDTDEIGQYVRRAETKNSWNFSDIEEEDKDEFYAHMGPESTAESKVWDLNNEVCPPSVPHQIVEQIEQFEGSNSEQKTRADLRLEWAPPERILSSSSSIIADQFEDPVGMPPEWAPPNVSVPVLNLVDKIFQLKRRGWLRRQVFWISKQILQLMMEDAIDDWLLRQVHWLRREDVVAQGIRWIKDTLWPGGIFFRRLATQGEFDGNNSRSTYDAATASSSKASETGSFKQHLEETRRANEVRKILLERAPTTLVSLIGQKQYKRCAKDIYYFSQSTVCVKQLSYGALELLIISVFPELREVVIDLHKQMRGKAVV